MTAPDDPHPADFRPSRVRNNFNPVSKDFFRALGLARLSGTETLLVFRGMEESWFRGAGARGGLEGEAAPFRLDVPALAEESGVAVSLLYRGVKALEAKGIFARAADGSHAIAKDYRAWTRDDGATPLLGPRQVESARSAANPGRPAKGRGGVTKTSLAADENVTPSDEFVSRSDENVKKTDEIVTESDENVTRALEERARGLRLETERLNGLAGQTRDARREESPEPDAAGRLAARISAHYREAPDDNGEHYRREALIWLAHHPEPVVDLAVTRALAETRSRSGAGLCSFVAAKLDAAARDVARSAGAAAAPKAAPASPPAWTPSDDEREVMRRKAEYWERRRAEAEARLGVRVAPMTAAS